MIHRAKKQVISYLGLQLGSSLSIVNINKGLHPCDPPTWYATGKKIKFIGLTEEHN